MQAGDIVVRARGGAVRSASDLRQAISSLKEKEPLQLELYRDGRLRKFQLQPDRHDRMTWDIRRFTQKVDNLKSHISDEAEMIYRDEIRKMQQSREKALGDRQRQKEISLLKLREASSKMVTELKKLQAEKNKLRSEVREKYAEELKRIQEELTLLGEKLREESEKEAAGVEKDR